MLTSVLVTLELVLSLACIRCDVIYPSSYKEQQLATRIHCQEKETQHFQYSSATKLWGNEGGEIVLKADIALHCLGDDKGGKYESQALKYLAEVSNLVIESKNFNVEEKASLVREKRDVKDFFSNAWSRVKRFFKRVFRGQTESTSAPVPTDSSVGDRGDLPQGEEKESEMVDLQPLYSVPFQFVQFADGSIPEVRFAENEVEDTQIRNFKRHLVDVFSTQLNFDARPTEVVETTVTGEHKSSYDITINGEASSLNLAGLGSQRIREPTVIVKKTVTDKDIKALAPTDALNDRDKMELSLQQMQIFQGGKMVSSSGTSSVVLLPDSASNTARRKRETEDDLTLKFRAHSTFDLQVKRRRKRSADEDRLLELHSNLAFVSSSRLAQKQENVEREKIRKLQESTDDISQVIEDLVTNYNTDYDEKLQILSEMVEREVSQKMDNESNSVSKAVRDIMTKQGVLQSMCSHNFSVCKDFLQLLVLAGGPEAEKIFLSFFSRNSTFSEKELQVLASLIGDFPSPSENFLNTLILIISQKHVDRDTIGSLCLSSGSLAYRAEDKEKRKVATVLLDLLEESKGKCSSDPLLLDVLESIGNLGCSSTVMQVLDVCKMCPDSSTKIACSHALRQHSQLTSVQLWIEETVSTGDCDVIDSVVGSLLDKIQEQETSEDSISWPRKGFNRIDEYLKAHLKSHCSAEDVVRYFGRKRDPVANSISQNYFSPEAEPWDPGTTSRLRRALWDDLNCDEWTEDSKFRPIQDKEEFASDRKMYNKRKSCLAYRRLGVKGANAEIYAGMFAGVKEPSDPPKYKLFTKFVSGLNFLGNQMEIGSFYFYHHSGNTKAYVRILGKTRQELTHDGCTPTDLTYRPIRHIPLYEVSLANFKLSLGIHLSSQLALDTSCPDNEIYELQPMTNVRIGGEALGYVAAGRGGINLGGNFNYKLHFTFTPTPNMCLKGSHGYDPMSISFETFFQLWNVAKGDWGKHRIWKPNFLSWNIRNGQLKTWFDDTCIRTEPSDDTSSPLDSERELE